jgi:TPR repeat protein
MKSTASKITHTPLIEEPSLKVYQQITSIDPLNNVSDSAKEIEITNTEISPCADEIFLKAIEFRQQCGHDVAFPLFTQAAQEKHIKAMGPMGRAYFLAEGTDEDHPLGLAWLIQAANGTYPKRYLV